MAWNPWRKRNGSPNGNPNGNPNEKSPGSSAQVEFEEAARQVVAEEVSEPVVPSPEPEREEIKLPLSLDDAREAVKACFWPLAHYVDPAWALTDAEAEKPAPKMQAFLQWALLKYLPLFTLKLAGRYSELVAMLTAMALLTWHKAHAVAALQAERQKARAGELDLAEPVPVQGEEVSSGLFRFPCEVCGREFASRESAAAHLPCNSV